jgi:hypothetical protein
LEVITLGYDKVVFPEGSEFLVTGSAGFSYNNPGID